MATIGETKAVRTSWADLRDSSAEDLDSQPSVPPPLLHADSYIETPEPSFDDWNGSVVATLGRATALSKEELVAEEQRKSPARSNGALRPNGSSEAPLERTATVAWNADAAEFVPMTSQLSVNGNSTSTEQATDLGHSRRRLDEEMEGTPSASPSRRTRQKRRGTAPQPGGPFGNKRTRTEEELEANATSSSGPSTRLSVTEPSTGGDTPMADAGNTEEDWQRRHEKRTNVVQSIKTTTEYEVMLKLREEGKLGASAPRTPDGNDRSISKRKWEQEVMQWRNALRNFTRASASPSPDGRVILPIVESSRR
mmetsp:Transcript_14361/g.23476  ORF Transcript_14361/g.23476 Transcript_14361/m.23476 type:complete len:310 (+) Transcript_14361:66-995(+)|eukprot:CAMPEP_0169151304 /NCGR_PEP_ID=MMETSP1015-20121227/50741_1 /TAXON_ID=342587 /ORGANISM="Karlodinium micrum, Strain CCMP2283" /LENGTH=309 /DNA_ID=CAMNT_0009220687 /DNA_START=65 /DNA_END=994 /DNA_ORIENTATION=-